MCAGSFAAAVFDTNASDITEMPSSGDRCTRMPEYYTAVEQYRVGGGGKPRASTRSTRSPGKGDRESAQNATCCVDAQSRGTHPHRLMPTCAVRWIKTETVLKVCNFPKRQPIF